MLKYFSELQKALKNGDHPRVGHPSGFPAHTLPPRWRKCPPWGGGHGPLSLQIAKQLGFFGRSWYNAIHHTMKHPPKRSDSHARYHCRHRHTAAALRHRHPASVRPGHPAYPGRRILPRPRRPHQRTGPPADGTGRPTRPAGTHHRQRFGGAVPRPPQLHRGGLRRDPLPRLSGGAERGTGRPVRPRRPAGQRR